ncbi:Uncharacterised protein [Shigella sonnei]|nr:Uncharacterised protein [Shigella sonnei]CSQ80008.1 Uncharacterised protein [Shigella sonnei]CSR94852.1 Uncharacterised protein [Shigella sonnei]
MQPHITLLTQIFAFGDPISHTIARDVADQINSTLCQLRWSQFFCRCVDGVTHPVDDHQAVIQFLALGIVQIRPLHFTRAFRGFVTLPECPAAIRIPAFTA